MSGILRGMDATPPLIILLDDGALLLVYDDGSAWRLERDGCLVLCDASGVRHHGSRTD